MCEEMFALSKEDFLKKAEDQVKLNARFKSTYDSQKNDTYSFFMKRKSVKGFTSPIKAYLKYRKIVDIECRVDCEKQRVKNIIIYFESRENMKQDVDKKISIYSNKIYDSKIKSISYDKDDHPKNFYETFESKDKELEKVVRPLFKHICEQVDNIFEKKTAKYVKLEDKFKKRFF